MSKDNITDIEMRVLYIQFLHNQGIMKNGRLKSIRKNNSIRASIVSFNPDLL